VPDLLETLNSCDWMYDGSEWLLPDRNDVWISPACQLGSLRRFGEQAGRAGTLFVQFTRRAIRHKWQRRSL
jgi:hypothetical protein